MIEKDTFRNRFTEKMRCASRTLPAVAAIMFISFSACGTAGSNSGGGHDGIVSGPAAAVMQIESVPARRTYPITDSSAGPFRIGAVIPEKADGFELEKSTESKTGPEGEATEISVYTYHIGNEGWVKISPQYDSATGRTNARIGGISICSDLFLTDEGIGAMSSIEGFADAYPDIDIRYSDEDGMFAVETARLPNVRFLLRNEHNTGAEHDPMPSHHGKPNVSDFEENSCFAAIRIGH